MTDPQVAGLADEPGQAPALRADDQYDGVDRRLQLVEAVLAVGVQAHDQEAGVLGRLERPGQVGDLTRPAPGRPRRRWYATRWR